jgi:hypothetical protein
MIRCKSSRRNLFANSTVLKRQWLPHRLLSARTVRNRLTSVGYRSRRPVKTCLLTQAHNAICLQWCQTCRQWIQRMIVKVRHNTCFKDVLPIDLSIEVASYCNEVKLTVIWYTSAHHDRSLLRKPQHKQRSVVAIRALCHLSVVPHFDNHPLNTRSVFMNDNARLHRARIVRDYLRDESITILPWPAPAFENSII